MKKHVLKATSFQAESLLKGIALPDNTTVVGITASASLGKIDVILVHEYDVEEEKK